MNTAAMNATCPSCRGRAQAATTRAARNPRPGDICVCRTCGAICIFTMSLKLTPLTPAAAQCYDPYLVLDAIRLSEYIRSGAASARSN